MFSSSISASLTISVPGLGRAPGSTKLDKTCTRTPSFMARPTLRVCNTFAPTDASSSISS